MLFATLLALAAAVLHASWNLAMKSSGDRFTFMWALMVWGGIISIPVAVVLGRPGWQIVPYVAASAIIHVVYTWFLARSYDLGDFSVAYPLARGGGAFLAALGGIALLNDSLSTGAAVGIAIVVIGLFALARLKTSGLAVTSALVTALTIGAYTIIDSAGSRAADAPSYGAFLLAGEGVALTLFGTAAGRGHQLLPEMRKWRVMVAGAAGAAAYIAVLVAVRHAPVGYVACLRESSVVLGALGGWLLLKEPMAHARLAASCVVAGGVALLVIAR